MLPLELPRHLTGSALFRRGGIRQGHAGERAENDNPPQIDCIKSSHPPLTLTGASRP
jgi:hypothetical protein